VRLTDGCPSLSATIFGLVPEDSNSDAVVSLANAQVEFRSTGSSEGDIERAVESVDNFLYARSNIRLSDTVKTRLVAAELQVALGANSRLSSEQLIDVLTEVAFRRLQSLSDEDIRRATATYEKSYIVDGSYAGFTWNQIKLSPAKFEKNLKQLRDQSKVKNGDLRNTLHKLVAGSSPESGVNGRLQLYAQVLPEQFGNVMQVGISPLQALLIAYAIASDDPIHVTRKALEKEMAHAHKHIGGQRYPEPNGGCPFGTNGYLFATPLDLILNDQMIESMLDVIQARTKV
jgi:hypothetical protein